jgi:predicted glycoside hydrolase/deacetylase ChbG (UPF0249 family)
MKSLIVNADDYGRTPNVSRGIRHAHLNGIVTSTTAMMNMPNVDADLQAARENCPRLGLGVHLTLTAAAPVLPAAQVKTLVTSDGRFLSHNDLVSRVNQVDVMQVKAEWQAQIEKFCALAGRLPDHLDSHHHTSYLTPALFEAMLELASQYRCAIRPLQARTERDLDRSYPRPVPHPDNLITEFYDSSATHDHLATILAGLQEGVSELMSHPGYSDDELMSGSSYNVQRENELQVLTDPRIKAMLKTNGIELHSFDLFRTRTESGRDSSGGTSS